MLPSAPDSTANSHISNTTFPGRIILDNSPFPHPFRRDCPPGPSFLAGFTDDEDRVGVPPVEALPLQSRSDEAKYGILSRLPDLLDNAKMIITQCIPDIQKYLGKTEEYDDIEDRMLLVYRGREGNDKESFVPTLLIDLPQDTNRGSYEGCWLKIAGMVVQYAARRLQIWCEICADELSDRRYIAPVKSTDPFWRFWSEGFRNEVLKIAMEHNELAAKWLTIDLIRIGREEIASENPITISFTTSIDLVSYHWQQARAQIVQLLGHYGFPYVQVEFNRGGFECYPFDHRAVGTNPDLFVANNYTRFDEKVNMGTAFGSAEYPDQGKSSFGTLGGYIQLSSPGMDPIVVGVSNYHVLRFGIEKMDPETHNAIEHSMLSICDEEPINALDTQHDSLDRHCLVLEAPPRRLHNERLARRRKFLKTAEHQASIDKVKKAEAFERDFFDTGKHLLGIPWMTSSSGRLGRDRVTRAAARLDWALIEVDQARIGTNMIPSSNWQPSTNTMRVDYTLGQKLSGIASEQKLADLIEKRAPVWKWGACSGGTTGTLMAESFVKMFRQWETPPRGAESSTELAILGDEVAFGSPGDSGSFVCSGETLIGLFWGSNRKPGSIQTIGYFTAIADVFDDIKDIAASDMNPFNRRMMLGGTQQALPALPPPAPTPAISQNLATEESGNSDVVIAVTTTAVKTTVRTAEAMIATTTAATEAMTTAAMMTTTQIVVTVTAVGTMTTMEIAGNPPYSSSRSAAAFEHRCDQASSHYTTTDEVFWTDRIYGGGDKNMGRSQARDHARGQTRAPFRSQRAGPPRDKKCFVCKKFCETIQGKICPHASRFSSRRSNDDKGPELASKGDAEGSLEANL
ncbi:hypothetical protein GGR54DRAFT_647413 [Hypoxylon sp. NC1633]|nr:hypothetical protein GGR54DRAFT_647413 [Hypoxylon sp. NC1633]